MLSRVRVIGSKLYIILVCNTHDMTFFCVTYTHHISIWFAFYFSLSIRSHTKLIPLIELLGALMLTLILPVAKPMYMYGTLSVSEQIYLASLVLMLQVHLLVKRF